LLAALQRISIGRQPVDRKINNVLTVALLKATPLGVSVSDANKSHNAVALGQNR
jgi:hypothetical protein